MQIQSAAAFIICTLALFTSCQTYDLLFQVSPEQSLQTFELDPTTAPIIRKGDKITISVWGHEELSIGSVNSTFSSNEATGRWLVIDKAGEVNLPRLGRIKLEGYNIKEANYFLERLYLNAGVKDPIVNIRVLNHYITLLGEVKSPGNYQIGNEKVTLIDIIGMAQGLTEYAKADEVRIIRKKAANTYEVKIDLTKYTSIADYNFVLQPDDVVYVPPTKNKRFDKAIEKITPIAGILTSLAVIYSVFFQ